MSNTVLQRKKSEYSANIIPGTKFKSFMDLLLEMAMETGVLNDREIREHVDTIVMAGHDTSANVIMYTIEANPDVQEKAAPE